jgi:arylsulfatase A-like enzyme
VLFTSDNGGPQPGKVTDNGPLRGGKGSVWEGGVRVAACMAYPGVIPAGGVVTQPLHVVDIYPTLVKLAGGDLSPAKQKLALDGADAWDTIVKGAPSPNKEILLNAAPQNGAIRMGDWKLIVGGGRGGGEDENGEPTDATPKAGIAANAPVELFNLASDPGEKQNVAAANPEKVKELRAAYDRLAAQAIPPKAKPKPADFKSPAVWGEK